MARITEADALSVVECIGSGVGSIIRLTGSEGDGMMNRNQRLTRCRTALIVFIGGLVLSGLTAFPLLFELNLLGSWLGIVPETAPQAYVGVRFWLATVRAGLEHADSAYPWLAYGTDWLAFAHLAIAVFFIGPLIDPVRNRWVLVAGLICCALVVPLALIAGAFRGIPLYWRLIDCSFGVFGAIPLAYCLGVSRDLD
jgi:hypothetical protein